MTKIINDIRESSSDETDIRSFCSAVRNVSIHVWLYATNRTLYMNEKVIRATIVVDLPYDNKLLNDVSELREELKRMLKGYNFSFDVETGHLDHPQQPLNKII